jgi:hypothetical protein
VAGRAYRFAAPVNVDEHRCRGRHARERSRDATGCLLPRRSRDPAWRRETVAPLLYRARVTVIHRPTRSDLEERRRAILARLGLTDEELKQKADQGGLVGHEWSAWAEILDIEYLLSGD